MFGTCKCACCIARYLQSSRYDVAGYARNVTELIVVLSSEKPTAHPGKSLPPRKYSSVVWFFCANFNPNPISELLKTQDVAVPGRDSAQR